MGVPVLRVRHWPERSWTGSNGGISCCKSSKRVQCGEPDTIVPDLLYPTDSITRSWEVLPRSAERIADPAKDSNPLRDRGRHPFGSLIAIPRNPQAIIRRVWPRSTLPRFRRPNGNFLRLRVQYPQALSSSIWSDCKQQLHGRELLEHPHQSHRLRNNRSLAKPYPRIRR
jgi:hypothetical protein